MKKSLSFHWILILFISLFLFSSSIGLTTKSASLQDHNPFAYLPTSTTKQVIKHSYYALSYNEKYEQAEWVSYFLRSENEGIGHFKRPRFIKDPKVTTKSAVSDNYKKSGYDRGHLCAAADMRFSKLAFDDTFYTSNVAPQKHNFNDGIWKQLEEKSRYWATKYNGIYVVTGGILQKGLPTIGFEKVAIPNYFYKILYCNYQGKNKMVAFLIPSVKSKEPLYRFVVSVDSIEKMTGIDFFPQLNDSVENELERKSDYKAWAF
ncbi:MAG: DNA/RNA non-specific endonuclease [Flavobacterium sp.]|nr:DNA/RNA non-specific endonuclease [Flavobacterium sp.]